jgi:hypothetical protein
MTFAQIGTSDAGSWLIPSSLSVALPRNQLQSKGDQPQAKPVRRNGCQLFWRAMVRTIEQATRDAPITQGSQSSTLKAYSMS